VIMSVEAFRIDVNVFIGLSHNAFYVRLTDILAHASYKLTYYFCGSRLVQSSRFCQQHNLS
jgi:hypothetical protein